VNRAVGSGGPNPKKDVVAEHIAQQRRRELYAQKAQLFDNDWDKHVLGRIAKDRKVEKCIGSPWGLQTGVHWRRR